MQENASVQHSLHLPHIPRLCVEDETVGVRVRAAVVLEGVLLLSVAVTSLVATEETQPNHRVVPSLWKEEMSSPIDGLNDGLITVVSNTDS